MHVQILEIDKRLRARCVANAPHSWAMLIKAAGWAEPASSRNVKRPGIRAWGQYHSRVIGSMGGECGLLRRRHSGKGRAVPERLPVDPYFVMRALSVAKGSRSLCVAVANRELSRQGEKVRSPCSRCKIPSPQPPMPKT